MSRMVGQAEGLTYAQRNNILFIETSAKSNDNIDRAFEEILKIIIKDNPDKSKKQESQVLDRKLMLESQKTLSKVTTKNNCC